MLRLFWGQLHYNSIVGMKLHRLGENIVAAAIELTPDDLSEIDSAASKITVQGAATPNPSSG